MTTRTEARTTADSVSTRLGSPAGRPTGVPPTIPPAPHLPEPKRQRRPLLLAAGIVLVVLGAVGAYWLATSSSHRVAVVALAADVPWGQVITAADVVEAQIVADPVLRPIPWTDRASIVGNRAASDLHAGALVTDRDLMTEQIPADGQALVGVAVKAGHLPVTELAARQQVWIASTNTSTVTTAGPPTGTAAPIRAVVLTAGEPDASGARTVDVLVADSDAATVAGWSAAGVAAIIVVPGR